MPIAEGATRQRLRDALRQGPIAVGHGVRCGRAPGTIAQSTSWRRRQLSRQQRNGSQLTFAGRACHVRK